MKIMSIDLRNLNSLTDLLSCLDIKFSVIGISETWLSESPHSTDINGILSYLINLNTMAYVACP